MHGVWCHHKALNKALYSSQYFKTDQVLTYDPHSLQIDTVLFPSKTYGSTSIILSNGSGSVWFQKLLGFLSWKLPPRSINEDKNTWKMYILILHQKISKVNFYQLTTMNTQTKVTSSRSFIYLSLIFLVIVKWPLRCICISF